MKQYCKYCNNLVTDNGIYCTELNKEMREGQANKLNNCSAFIFNEINAFTGKKYVPRNRKKKEVQGQISLFSEKPEISIDEDNRQVNRKLLPKKKPTQTGKKIASKNILIEKAKMILDKTGHLNIYILEARMHLSYYEAKSLFRLLVKNKIITESGTEKKEKSSLL